MLTIYIAQNDSWDRKEWYIMKINKATVMVWHHNYKIKLQEYTIRWKENKKERKKTYL